MTYSLTYEKITCWRLIIWLKQSKTGLIFAFWKIKKFYYLIESTIIFLAGSTGGKSEFPESFFEAALRELKEETGLTALNLELKGISGFTNSIGNERFVFYDFLCTQFTGELSTSAEGEPKWWNLKDIDKIPMQDEIRKRLPLYLRKGSFESINYWDDNKKCISENKTILFD